MNAIIGGGIAGLTTALAFEKLGIPYKIFERSSEIRSIGAGIWLAPNALKVFDWLGVLEELKNEGNLLHGAMVCNNKFKPIFETVNEIEFKGNPLVSLAIHRAKLQAFLISKLREQELKLGRELLKFELNNYGVTVSLSNGKIRSYKNLIAADGINSKVRNQIFPDSKKRYSGQTCWRGVSETELPEEYLHKGVESWGKGVRFGFSRIASGKVYWFAVKTSKANAPNITRDELSELFKSFHPMVQELILNTPETNILKNDLYDLKHKNNWYQTKACLIGDAAHATTPNMGQGGCQAVEDAYYLSLCMQKYGESKKAFQKFEELRKDKVNYVVRQSWLLGKIAHYKYGRGFRNFILSQTPRSTVKRNMEKLYAIASPDEV